ncbi:MAG: leucine-rich repeat domain-containing protein [Clostridia bacterium]|nr:leucine-rich repeat domain-containing protein [Clostridia bacterium]
MSMTNNYRRLLFVILILVVALAAILCACSDVNLVKEDPQEDEVDEEYTSDLENFRIEYVGDEAILREVYNCNSIEYLMIPAQITRIELDDMGRIRMGSNSFKKIKFEENSKLYFIADKTFEGSKDLTTIELPDSLEIIGERAFYNCEELKNIRIPKNVTSIGEDAFILCTNVSKIQVDEDNKTFDSRDNCNAIIDTAKNEILLACNSTTIPNSITSIGSEAFFNCKKIRNLEIPSTITQFGDDAFSGMYFLESVVLPNNLTKISKGMFWGDKALKMINMPTSVTIIEEMAFCGCEALDNLDLHEGIVEIGESALSGTGLTNINIPSTITTLSSGVFAGTAIKSITIPETITEIKDNAFSYCRFLESVIVPSSIKANKLGDYAFRDCTSLKSVVLPEGFWVINNWTFMGDAALTSVVLPSTITVISYGAFGRCTSLEEIQFNGTISQFHSIQINYSYDEWFAENFPGENYSRVVHCTDGDTIYAPEYKDANDR